jgi:hypothetical protein
LNPTPCYYYFTAKQLFSCFIHSIYANSYE